MFFALFSCFVLFRFVFVSALQSGWKKQTRVLSLFFFSNSLLRGTIIIRTCDQRKTSIFPYFYKPYLVLIIMYPGNRVFAICQILLGRKTCKYYYETDELPNPRRTQPKKKWVEGGIRATFSHSIYFFVGWARLHIGSRTTRNSTQLNFPQTSYVL